MTYNNFLPRYEHPFEFVIKTVKVIRQLQSLVQNNNSATCHVIIKNNVLQLGLILDSYKGILHLCKIKTLIIHYIDETDNLNNFCLELTKDV